MSLIRRALASWRVAVLGNLACSLVALGCAVAYVERGGAGPLLGVLVFYSVAFGFALRMGPTR